METPELTPEQIQKCKDFIWQYLAERDRDFVHKLANTEDYKRQEMYIKKINVWMNANKEDGLITREEFRLSVQ